MNLMEKIQSLNPGDFGIMIRAGLMLPLVNWRLKNSGFKRVYSWANNNITPDIPASDTSIARAVQLAKLVNFVASKRLYRANCLCRSLVLLRMMRREQLPGQLRLGIPKEGNEKPLSILNAHAWIESGGKVTNDHNDVGRSHVVFDLDHQCEYFHFNV